MFVIIKRSNIEETYNIIPNNIVKDISFTKESENYAELAFLDLLVRRNKKSQQGDKSVSQTNPYRSNSKISCQLCKQSQTIIHPNLILDI